MRHRVTLIPGDGTGPELTEATRRVLEATGVGFDWDVRGAGVEVMESTGTPLPAETLDSVKENRVALKGPITTPIGTGFRSVNVALRHELGLYACLRPCKTYPGVRSRYEQVDVVIVRENTEDLYAGIEFSAGSDEAHRVIDILRRRLRNARERLIRGGLNQLEHGHRVAGRARSTHEVVWLSGCRVVKSEVDNLTT